MSTVQLGGHDYTVEELHALMAHAKRGGSTIQLGGRHYTPAQLDAILVKAKEQHGADSVHKVFGVKQ